MIGRVSGQVAGIILALSLFAGLTACSQGYQYTYEAVSAEYGAAAPDQDTTPKDPSKDKPKFKPKDESKDKIEQTGSGAVSSNHKMSIESAIHTAIRNNPDIAMAVWRINRSEAMIEEAKASFWPVVDFYSEYMEGDAPSAYLFKTIDQRNLPPNINFNDPGSFRNFETGGTARINLFKGGRDVLEKSLSKKLNHINKFDLASVRNNLISSIIKAYFTSLAAREFIQIEKASVDTVGVQLKNVRIRYKGGSALKSEVLSLEVRLARERANLIRAENAYQISLASLANLIGLEADAGLEPESDGWMPPDLPGDYETGLMVALANRPELLKVREQVVSSKMSLDLQRRSYWPSLDAEAKGYFSDEDLNYDWERGNWVAAVLLNWEIFTGFSRKAKIDKARAVLGEMIATDRKITQSVQLDVKTAYLKRAESEARLKVARASSVQAEEALRLVKKQYEGGSATIVWYLDAQLAQNAAQVAETSAYYDLKKAEADLCRALGHFGDAGKGLFGGAGKGL